jgi:hypothetical protein
MVGDLIIGGIGFGGMITLAIWALLAERKYGRCSSKLTEQVMKVSMLENNLTASRQQRRDLAEAVIAANNWAHQLQKDLEDVADSIPPDKLDAMRSDVDGLLSFAEKAADRAKRDTDSLPAIGATVPGQLGGEHG